MRWLAAGVLVVVLVTSGCLGIGGEESTPTSDDAVTRARASIQGQESAIAGTVTDAAVEPVANATVRLLEINQTTTTDADGSFAIGPIDAGEYTLTVRAEGYLPTEKAVQAPAGDAATVDLVIAHVQETRPFLQTFELKGFMEYGWGAGLNLTGNASAVRDTNCDYDEIAGPNCRGNVDLEPPLDGLVFEMEWDPQTTVGDELYAMMRVRDNASIITGEWSFFTVEGASPIHYVMDRAELENVTDAFRERCQDGEDQFCGLSFRDRGWPMQTRVWPGWRCPTDQVGVCPNLQQDYTQYVTAFYHQPVPEDYSVVEQTQ